jgi:putative hydrolase of the HAD superfamily
VTIPKGAEKLAGGDIDRLEVLFFDATGTLFDVRGSVGSIYGSIARRHGVDAAAEDLDDAFRNAFRMKTDGAFPPKGLLGLEEEKAWWRDVVWQVFQGRMAESVFPGYFEDVFDVFRRSEAWTLFEDTSSSLDRMCAAGYRLAVISNFDSRLLDVLKSLGIADCFQQTFLSWKIGVAKPGAGIFEHALETMNVAPSQALHVGDSIGEDMEGALSAGLSAVLMDRKERHPSWNRSHRIGNLKELADLLCP